MTPEEAPDDLGERASGILAQSIGAGGGYGGFIVSGGWACGVV